ncbi:MAG: membrane dipeptidase [Deltaproteobacteria bacterium]|nr:membrane dipeptidase [Deltaproteobacteria bacterium]
MTGSAEGAQDFVARLQIGQQAAEIYCEGEVIDLHVESFIWTRVFGYDLTREHGHGLLGARYYSQVDFPRMLRTGLAGSVMSIATNPFRFARTQTLAKNTRRLKQIIEDAPGVQLVQSASDYRAARAAGNHACFIGLQGGNAIARSEQIEALDPAVTRVTVVHLTNSNYGRTSSPFSKFSRRADLSDEGCELIAALNQRKVMVDLSHISRLGFWRAIEAHDNTLPPIVSHTGVCGVKKSWRNIDDEQIRAIAARGGVVGVIYHIGFLGGRRVAAVAAHLDHLLRVGGEDLPALGSDWDGMITTPRDMKTVCELPRLVQALLDLGWSRQQISKTLGKNYLRVLAAVRP